MGWKYLEFRWKNYKTSYGRKNYEEKTYRKTLYSIQMKGHSKKIFNNDL
jgi:hypothetical protein